MTTTGTTRSAPFPRLARMDLGEVPYEEAVSAMEGWAAECRAGTAGDRLVLLSHPAVVTHGPRTPREHLPSAVSGLRTVEVDRGGQATYHGPGQVVGYLVAHVRERGPADVVRWMEEGLVAALAALGVPARRRDTPPGASSLVGVWTPDDRKVASIGMRIRGGVSTHGFALNVDPDMRVFDAFVSCGLAEPMTSLRVLADEAGRRAPSDADVRDAVSRALGARTG
ncbi:lipoyl(octanoyl) transferase LipB [Pseudonocardia kunmingensis]|uniref:Octanoyltransferase n=1 Tax=Pseudonocardia kunmingensis TaxID=630975 RepID=A0A543D0J7_9PSEU|nr:lipoyl(octanoyl) transferase LipB [Pseudonocardia kunmingensis]TQM02880.1 lipoyl(octanoyl) transferase [Pseudonocardia kunmingensis]